MASVEYLPSPCFVQPLSTRSEVTARLLTRRMNGCQARLSTSDNLSQTAENKSAPLRVLPSWPRRPEPGTALAPGLLSLRSGALPGPWPDLDGTSLSQVLLGGQPALHRPGGAARRPDGE